MNLICLTQANLVGSGNNSFVYRFPSSANFDNHSIALASLSCYSCVFNVTAALGNNILNMRIYDDLTYPVYTITIPDGSYTVSDLNAYFQYYSIQNGL